MTCTVEKSNLTEIVKYYYSHSSNVKHIQKEPKKYISRGKQTDNHRKQGVLLHANQRIGVWWIGKQWSFYALPVTFCNLRYKDLTLSN